MKSEASVHDEFEVFLCGLDDPLAMLETLGVTDKEHGRLTVDEALKTPSSPTLTPRSTSSSEQEDVASSDAAFKSPLDAHQARLNSKRQYRERRKSELHDLRVESRQLAARRDALAAKRRATEARLVRMSSEHKTIPGWRGVALRQMRQRVEAEALNRQLRAEVRANQALVERIQSVFTTQLGAVDVRRTLSLVSSSPNKPVAEFSAADMQIISMFTTEMETLYAQAEAVVDSHGLPLRPDSSYNSAVVRRWDPQTKSEHTDFVETFVIPFQLSDAARFLPSALLTLLAQECCPATMRVADTDDALALKFLFGSNSDNGTLIYQASSASKIIHEQHRTVLVWRALIEQQGDEAQYMGSGWSVIRVDASGRTVMRICTRVQPVNSIEGHDVDKYVNKLFTKGEGEALILNHTIENAIMDQLGAARIGCAR